MGATVYWYCKVRSFRTFLSYDNVRVQSNPFILKERGCTKTRAGKTNGVEGKIEVWYRTRKRQHYIDRIPLRNIGCKRALTLSPIRTNDGSSSQVMVDCGITVDALAGVIPGSRMTSWINGDGWWSNQIMR